MVDHYQQIAEAAYALLPQGFDETLVWAEFDGSLINSSVFARGADGVVRHHPLSPRMTQAISDHWESWRATKPAWRTFAYRIRNGGYSVDLEFAERVFGAPEWQERRHRVAEISFGSVTPDGAEASDQHRYETSFLSTGCRKSGEWSFAR